MLLTGDLEKLKSMLMRMAKYTYDVVSRTAKLLEEIDATSRASIWSEVDHISAGLDIVRREFVNEVLMFIARRQPLGRELLVAHTLISIAYDVYRISRYCREIARIDSMLSPESNVSRIADVKEIFDYAVKAVEVVLRDLVELKPSSEKKIIEIDNKVDEYYRQLLKEVISSDKVDRYTALKMLIARHVERIVDHANYIENYLKDLA